MKKAHAIKSSPTSGLTPHFFAILFCFFLLPNIAGGSTTKKESGKDPKTILQKIKDLCKKHAHNGEQNKKSKNKTHSKKRQSDVPKQNESSGFTVYEPGKIDILIEKKEIAQQEFINYKTEKNDSSKKNEIILDDYKSIKDFHAYDPASQEWIHIKAFKVVKDHKQKKRLDTDKVLDTEVSLESYVKFWAYNPTNQEWYKVSLVKHLQQTNTQINNNPTAVPIREQVLLGDSSESLSNDELLEELLGVHTPIADHNLQKDDHIWSNFSFDITFGAGTVFYENSLMNMSLVKNAEQAYFFISDSNECYKPNWFYHTLEKVNGSGPKQIYHLHNGNTYQPSFKGKGGAFPITLGVQYAFWEQLLVGVGRELIFNYTNKLVHTNSSTELAIPKKWSAQGRWFAKCGWYYFSNGNHRLFADTRLFYVHHLGNILRKTMTFGSYLHQAAAYNFGLGYEQQLTDCFALTARISVEWQRFKQFASQYPYNIVYHQPAVYLQVGLSMRLAKCSRHKVLKKEHGKSVKNKTAPPQDLEETQDLLDLT